MTTRTTLTFSLAALLALTLGLPNEVQSFGPKKTATAAAPAENMEIRDKWALSIGINRFSDSSIPSLKYAQKSSGDLARGLKDADFGHFGLDHVAVVNGPDASKAGIEQAFNDWLFKKALPNDLVIIYINTRLAKNSTGDLVLCANDTRLAELDKTSINLAELLKTARQRIGSTHIICMLDTSPVVNSADKPEHDVKWLASNSGIAVFSAAELLKPSLDDSASMRTHFTNCFVEALKTGGGNFPLAMIAEYVWQKVQELTKPAGNVQVPILALASEQSQTVTIPIGVMVKSSLPPRTVAIGHPVDNLAMDHPNIVAPTMSAGKPGVTVQSRNQSSITKPAPKVAPKTQTTAAKPANVSDDEEEDDFDPNLDLRPYVSKIKQDIQRKWQVPKGFESRKVTTMFSILRDGSIKNASIVEGSGNESVDNSALAALQAASPLDPLPKGSPRSVDIKYVFDWKTKMGNTQ